MPTTQPTASWTIDPNDPMAPPADVWQRMTPREQTRVADLLVDIEHPVLDAMAPEGSRHDDQVTDLADRVRNWFSGGTRSVFVARNMRVFYPNARPFDPDLFVVFDVPTTPRDAWFVSREQRGIDVAIEVLWKGERSKDRRRNVERYARCGIPEYYVVDLQRRRLHAYRLATTGNTYDDVSPSKSAPVRSPLLGLDLMFDGVTLTLLHGITIISSSREGVGRLQLALSSLSDDLRAEADRADREQARADEEKARADEEKARADEEKARADALAEQVAALLAARET